VRRARRRRNLSCRSGKVARARRALIRRHLPFPQQLAVPGVVVGGTGRFVGATGSFTMRIDGLFALPGLVHVAEGTIEIALDRK
jgi:hypothetical protein